MPQFIDLIGKMSVGSRNITKNNIECNVKIYTDKVSFREYVRNRMRVAVNGNTKPSVNENQEGIYAEWFGNFNETPKYFKVSSKINEVKNYEAQKKAEEKYALYHSFWLEDVDKRMKELGLNA